VPSRREFFARGSRLAAGALACLPADGLLERAASGGVAVHPSPQGAAPRRSLRLLVLGGTRHVGAAVVREALARDHAVTLFNRGRTNPWLFPGVPRLRGDRRPERDDGLRAFAGGSWDAVIDLPAYYPRHVEASAAALSGRVERYIMMSSISVYQSFRTVGLRESAPLRQLTTPFVETEELVEGDWPTYGARKALCERAVASAFPDRWTAIRACQIFGGGVSDDANTYWPARMRRGGDVPVPGTGEDALQLVDVRDVAAFVVHSAEAGLGGAYNVVGPDRPLTFGDYVRACQRVTGGAARLVWLGASMGAADGSGFPYYTPEERAPGFARVDGSRAVAAGMRARGIEDSIAADWQWFKEHYPPDYDFPGHGTGLSAERERELLARARST
jgi:2'-hydroxyisoflavone reductase